MRRMYSENQLEKITDSRIKALVEGGTLDNAKPIYCHPLEIYASGQGVLTALLFNNSSEKINSWTKLKTAISAFNPEGECRLLVSGGLTDTENSKYVIGSEIYVNNDDGNFILIGYATDGTIYNASANFNITSISFQVQDDVNKIN